MKKFKKLIMLLLCVTMLLPSATAFASQAGDQGNQDPPPVTNENEPDLQIVSSNLPAITYGRAANIGLTVKNNDVRDVYNVKVKPVLSENSAQFPFEIKEVTYEREISQGPLASGENYVANYDFVTKSDIPSGTIKVSFEITYQDTPDGSRKSVLRDIYLQATGNPDGSGEPGEPGEKKPTSTPRIIVAGFTTEPETVKAGETFKLTLQIKNTSTKTAVSNLELNLQAAPEGKDADTVSAAFLPVSGSSSIYVESIPKNSTKEVSIDMTAKADLLQKPYVLNVSMNYEDPQVNPYTAEASVSIPVKQEARVEVSEPEVMPGSIEIGSESNIMFSIYNTGKTKLYNVSVVFEGDSISGGDAFVGNIESGATGNVDVMLQGQAATMDDGTINIIVTYEDDAGQKSTIEKTMTLYVNEIFIDEGFPGEFPEEMPMEEQGGISPLLIVGIVIAVIVIAGGVTAFIIIKKKKKGEGIEDEIS